MSGWWGWIAFLTMFVIHMVTRRQVEEQPEPRCFGEYPHRHPHIAAERDCGRCPFVHRCFEETPYFGA